MKRLLCSPLSVKKITTKYGLQLPVETSKGVIDSDTINVQNQPGNRNMDLILVTPHVGIGPLKLAMSPQQILAAINKLRESCTLPVGRNFQIAEEKEDDGYTLRYAGNSFFFMVRYRNNQAIEISVDRDISEYLNVTLYEKEVFKLEAEEWVNILKNMSSYSYDLDDEQLSTCYEFPDIGIRLWREYPFHRKLLASKAYVERMSLMIDEMYQYLYFQVITVM